MVVRVSMTHTGLTRQSRRRMLVLSRRCRTAPPPFAATATERAHRVVAHRAPAERNPNQPWRRIILRITRVQGMAFTRDIALALL